ncbi:patatin-like phospholipase family protein [Kutzneria kofuensis]|uniref:patatin-like phospholipase family protein n=1 Tax=Kutzneria kofuensis TaxID=103725 RepID=UPI0031F07F8D
MELWISVQGHDVYKPRLDLWRLLRPAGLVRLPTSDLMGYALDSVGWTWLLDTAPARKTLTAALGGERLRIRDGVRVVVAAVEECSGEVVHFTNSAPPGSGFTEVQLTVDHLMAGAAAPILFPPVHIDGRTYVDAGMVANTPLRPAMAYEPETVVVVTSSCGRQSGEPASLGDALGLAFENVARFAVLRDYEHTRQLAELRPGGTPRFVLVEPTDEFEVSGFARSTRTWPGPSSRTDGPRPARRWPPSHRGMSMTASRRPVAAVRRTARDLLGAPGGSRRRRAQRRRVRRHRGARRPRPVEAATGGPSPRPRRCTCASPSSAARTS